MTAGIPVSSVIAVTVNLQPPAAQFANFNSLLILGDSDVIDTKQRLRPYTGLTAVANDFGVNAPEYKAANLFFAQVPQPTNLFIGRWARTATSGRLQGGIMSAAQQALANFNAIANGGFKIQVDGGGLINVTGINLVGVQNLNAVATAINTALGLAGEAVVCTWNPIVGAFLFESNSTGIASAVALLQAPNAGTDLSPLILCNAATNAPAGGYLVQGIAAETALAAVVLVDGLSTPFYGLMFASSTMPVNADYQAVSAYIEGASNPHIFGVTSQEGAALTIGDATSIGALLKPLAPKRTIPVFSSSSPYAVASEFGKGLTVNPAQANSTITLMFKGAPLLAPEVLTASQKQALDANNYTYFAQFTNNTAIIVNGTMSSGNFFDEIWGSDWFANQVQTDLFNAFFTSSTKIPQTDSGAHLLVTTAEQSCAAGVNNGLLAPGTWTAGGFGQLKQGDFLSKGYYVFCAPVATQAPADRSARKAPPIQIAAKLAGAFHSASVLINVNR